MASFQYPPPLLVKKSDDKKPQRTASANFIFFMKTSKWSAVVVTAFASCSVFGQTNIFPASGKTGIGTTSPVVDLDVRGTAYVASTSSSDGYLSFVPGGSGYAAYIGWYRSGPTRLGYMGYQDLAGNPNNLGLNLENSANFIIGGGNVGIRTGTPKTAFQVNGAIAVGQTAPGTWTTNGSDIFLNAGAPNQAINLRPNGDSSGVGQASFTAWGVDTFYDSSGNPQVVFANGNVGIGTSNPTQKLAVNGTVRAKEVVVETTGWSDYVFAPQYKLLPLSQLDQQIHSNGHLPGIPSAAEAAKGVNIGEMQAKLLAKIEEITLHLIAEQKEIEQLRTENHELRAQMAELAKKY